MKVSDPFLLIKSLVFTMLFVSLRLNADTGPEATVESLHNALLTIARMDSEDNFGKKYSLLEPTISESFDFRKIAKLVTGSHWEDGLKTEQEDFEKSLLGVAVHNYVLNFKGNSKLQFKLVKKTIRKNKAVIETSLINPGDTITKLKYVLYKRKERWFIVNVVAQGVSDLSLKRADYMRFLESNTLGDLAKKLFSSKKPLIIIGESALELKSGKYLVEGLKNILIKNNFINKEWNAFNFLPQNASTVGLIDLKILSKEDEEKNSFFEKLNNNKFKLLYLLGSDNLEIKKNNEFIVYQGSHGDRGAEIADIVFPSAAFTEQSGLYENLEGRVQECRKASYPIGEALEDWKIFNLILKKLDKNDKLLNFDSLRKETLSLIPNFTEINELPSFDDSKVTNTSPYFFSEIIKIRELDYFFTNSISRASKTMSECRQIKQDSKKTGTDN